MRLAASLVALVALAGCGNSGIEGTLNWAQDPSVSAHALDGRVRNTTSHSVTLDAKSMRLLDDRGRKLPGRINAGTTQLKAHASTHLGATWKSGKPVRIDYGSGTLALPSG
jgi:hypothetical protein